MYGLDVRLDVEYDVQYDCRVYYWSIRGSPRCTSYSTSNLTSKPYIYMYGLDVRLDVEYDVQRGLPRIDQ